MDPYKAPFGLPSLPFGMNNIVWKFVVSKWREGLTPAYEKLAELSGRPIDDFAPTRDEVMDCYASFGMDGPLHFLPYYIAQDPAFQGVRPTDTPRHVYTGNLVLPAQAAKGTEFGEATNVLLERFLAACETPPVYIGWGSLVAVSPKWMSLMAVRSLKAAGVKGVVLGGWAGVKYDLIEGEPDTAELQAYCKDNILFVDSATHEMLFPRCSVIVHHGGIGTTTAGVRSGRPNVVTPIFYDQYDSAMLCADCGQGIDAGALPKLTPEQLAAHIRSAMTDEVMIRTAAEIGTAMRQRNGAKETVELFTKFLKENVAGGEYWKHFDAFATRKHENTRSFFSKLSCCTSHHESVQAEEVKVVGQRSTLLEDFHGPSQLKQRPRVPSAVAACNRN